MGGVARGAHGSFTPRSASRRVLAGPRGIGRNRLTAGQPSFLPPHQNRRARSPTPGRHLAPDSAVTVLTRQPLYSGRLGLCDYDSSRIHSSVRARAPYSPESQGSPVGGREAGGGDRPVGCVCPGPGLPSSTPQGRGEAAAWTGADGASLVGVGGLHPRWHISPRPDPHSEEPSPFLLLSGQRAGAHPVRAAMWRITHTHRQPAGLGG